MLLPLNLLPACLMAWLILGSSKGATLALLLFESDLDICWLKELLFSAKFYDLLKKEENVALILEGCFGIERLLLFL